jgi:hypothetical protein
MTHPTLSPTLSQNPTLSQLLSQKPTRRMPSIPCAPLTPVSRASRKGIKANWLSRLDPNLVRNIKSPYLVNFYGGLASRIRHRGYLSVVAHSVQAFKFRVMMTEVSFVAPCHETIRVIRPRRR